MQDLHSYDDWLNKVKPPVLHKNLSENLKNFLVIWIKKNANICPEIYCVKTGINGIDLILSAKGSQLNYDYRSKLFADDILFTILFELYKMEQKKEKDITFFISELIIQMHDMYTTGTCTEGRVVRLMMVLLHITDPEQLPGDLKNNPDVWWKK